MRGERLKEVRRNHQDTQESLAKKLYRSTPAVSKWEQNQTNPDLESLIKICQIYNVSSDYLLGLTDYDMNVSESRKNQLSSEHQKTLDLFAAFLASRE